MTGSVSIHASDGVGGAGPVVCRPLFLAISVSAGRESPGVEMRRRATAQCVSCNAGFLTKERRCG